MGFIITGFSIEHRRIIERLEAEIRRVMTKAAVRLNIKNCYNEFYSQFWFGDSTPEWIEYLQIRLERMITLMKINPIEIQYIVSDYDHRTHYALAHQPRSGWQDHTEDKHWLYSDFLQRSYAQKFSISLGQRWHELPIYRPTPDDYDTKFHVLVHELSHLFMYLKDYAIEYKHSLDLVYMDTNKAQRNADNWGYFLEEFR